jgi:hypothetical protein
LRLGQILDRAIRLYRANFVTFIGIIALMLVPVSLLTLLVQVLNAPAALAAAESAANLGPNDNPFAAMAAMMSASTGGGLALVLSLINGLLVGVVATSALVRAAASANLGIQLTIGQAYSATTKNWGNVLLTVILFSFLMIGLFVWTLVPCVGWLTGVGLILFFTTAVRPLVAVAVVLEGQDAVRAIRRAWDLTRRRFFRAGDFCLRGGSWPCSGGFLPCPDHSAELAARCQPDNTVYCSGGFPDGIFPRPEPAVFPPSACGGLTSPIRRPLQAASWPTRWPCCHRTSPVTMSIW